MEPPKTVGQRIIEKIHENNPAMNTTPIVMTGVPGKKPLNVDHCIPLIKDCQYTTREDLCDVCIMPTILRSEWAKFREWAQEQLHKDSRTGCTNDRFSFMVSDSSIGAYMKAYDNLTGEEYEITDPSNF